MLFISNFMKQNKYLQMYKLTCCCCWFWMLLPKYWYCWFLSNSGLETSITTEFWLSLVKSKLCIFPCETQFVCLQNLLFARSKMVEWMKYGVKEILPRQKKLILIPLEDISMKNENKHTNASKISKSMCFILQHHKHVKT